MRHLLLVVRETVSPTWSEKKEEPTHRMRRGGGQTISVPRLELRWRRMGSRRRELCTSPRIQDRMSSSTAASSRVVVNERRDDGVHRGARCGNNTLLWFLPEVAFCLLSAVWFGVHLVVNKGREGAHTADSTSSKYVNMRILSRSLLDITYACTVLLYCYRTTKKSR